MPSERLDWEPGEKPPYALCEPVWASSMALWHIRPITENGLKFGGGVDTQSLCGRVPVSKGWDLNVRLTPHHLDKNVCQTCRTLYSDLVKP